MNKLQELNRKELIMLKINKFFILFATLSSTLFAMDLPERGQSLRKPVNTAEYYAAKYSTLESALAPLTAEESAQREENVNTASRIRRSQEKRYPKPIVTIIQKPTREERQSVKIPADASGASSSAKVSPVARTVLLNEACKAYAAHQANKAAQN